MYLGHTFPTTGIQLSEPGQERRPRWLELIITASFKGFLKSNSWASSRTQDVMERIFFPSQISKLWTWSRLTHPTNQCLKTRYLLLSMKVGAFQCSSFPLPNPLPFILPVIQSLLFPWSPTASSLFTGLQHWSSTVLKQNLGPGTEEGIQQTLQRESN